ncbi:MAG: PEGA domain-containing protein [Deltaproteobacteria bacterium]|nr:PEGA domain-containing protein [Deltaproteobacteria bacterium]
MSISPIAAAVVSLVAFAPAAPAQPTPPPGEAAVADAERLYNEGVAATEHEDFAAALRAFEGSYALNPLPDVLYNVGMCQKALGQLPQAANTFREYVTLVGDTMSADERAEFDALLAELVPQIGRISFQVNEQGSGVAVDGVPVGAGVITAWLAVEPGQHSVTAEKDGFDPVSAVLNVPAGSMIEARLDLVPEEEGREGISQTWFWITAGTAAALGVAGAITGGLELADEGSFTDAADRCNSGDDAGCSAARTVYANIETEADATTALLVVAGVAAAAAVTLIFFTDWDGEQPPVAVGVAPVVGEGGSGAVLGAILRF